MTKILWTQSFALNQVLKEKLEKKNIKSVHVPFSSLKTVEILNDPINTEPESILFVSKQAAQFFFNIYQQYTISLENALIICAGEKTATFIEDNYDVKGNIINYYGEIACFFDNYKFKNIDNMLVPISKTSKWKYKNLSKKKNFIEEWIIYENILTDEKKIEIQNNFDKLTKNDYIAVASPRSWENLLNSVAYKKVYKMIDRGLTIVSIGPVTTRKIIESGLYPKIEAQVPSIECMGNKIIEENNNR